MALASLDEDREVMSKASRAPNENQFLFGSDFLHDRVGQIIDEPTVAVLELIANCYDAGADHVEVKWPSLPGEKLALADNGIGMTREEFETRWRTLKYDRVAVQGADVVFPSGVSPKKRSAFGHNGKGRFSPGPSWRCVRSADCITATSAAPPEPTESSSGHPRL